jgi:hypothetical protein
MGVWRWGEPKAKYSMVFQTDTEKKKNLISNLFPSHDFQQNTHQELISLKILQIDRREFFKNAFPSPDPIS